MVDTKVTTMIIITEMGSRIMPISIETFWENCSQAYLNAMMGWYTPFTCPATKKYWYATVAESINATTSESVPSRPQYFGKYLLPNNAITKKVISGNKGIRAIYFASSIY